MPKKHTAKGKNKSTKRMGYKAQKKLGKDENGRCVAPWYPEVQK